MEILTELVSWEISMIVKAILVMAKACFDGFMINFLVYGTSPEHQGSGYGVYVSNAGNQSVMVYYHIRILAQGEYL